MRIESPNRALTPKKRICLAERYRPTTFLDLIGSDRSNRELAEWAARWRRGEVGLRPALLSGPPGTGKSTIVRLLAEINGFRPIVVNASAERTAAALCKRVRDTCEAAALVAKAERGALLVLDEVDGACLAGAESALTQLVEQAFDAAGNYRLARPMVFVCNNVYRRGLARLRRLCVPFRFRRDEQSVIRRLREIVAAESAAIDERTLAAIARRCDYDLRACLNDLELAMAGEAIESEARADRFPDYFQNIAALFSGATAPTESALQNAECFDGAFLNYLNADRPLCDLPLVDALLSAFARDDALQKAFGGRARYSVFALLRQNARQSRAPPIDFPWKTAETRRRRVEGAARVREFVAFAEIAPKTRALYVERLLRMLCPRDGRLSRARLVDVARLARSLGLRVVRRNADESEESAESDDEPSDRRPKAKRRADSFGYEPPIEELIQRDERPLYALREEIGAFLHANDGRETFGEFEAPQKRVQSGNYNVRYAFRDSAMSAVSYSLQKSFFFPARV